MLKTWFQMLVLASDIDRISLKASQVGLNLVTNLYFKRREYSAAGRLASEGSCSGVVRGQCFFRAPRTVYDTKSEKALVWQHLSPSPGYVWCPCLCPRSLSGVPVSWVWVWWFCVPAICLVFLSQLSVYTHATMSFLQTEI